MPLTMLVENTTHPLELQIVERMLQKQGLKPRYFTNKASPTTLRVRLPNRLWFTTLAKSIHFMTSCRCYVLTRIRGQIDAISIADPIDFKTSPQP